MLTEKTSCEEIAPLQYVLVRKEIQDGDILLFQGRGLFSRLIRWGSTSPYSHCAVVFWWHDRLMVFQVSGKGVEIVPASDCINKYNGSVEWWTLQPDLRDKVDLPELFTFCLEENGKPFGIRGLIVLGWRKITNRFRGRPDSKMSPTALFCSWYISRCFRKAGLDLVDMASDDCTSPGDLARSGTLVKRGVLRKKNS